MEIIENVPKKVGRPRGYPKTGGRQKGTPNSLTRDVRTALRDLAENNAENVQQWLDSVAEESPAEALRLYLMLIRYVIPVLSAAAIADVTPKPPRQALYAMSNDELLALIKSERVANSTTLPDRNVCLPKSYDNGEELLR